MKKISYIFAVALVAMFASCKKTAELPEGGPATYSIKATSEISIASLPKNTPVTVTFCATTTDTGVRDQLTATFKTGGQDYVDLYNLLVPEEKQAELLPEEAYTFVKNNVTIDRYNKDSRSGSIAVTNLNTMAGDKWYVLPVTMKAVTGSSKVSVDSLAVAYFAFYALNIDKGNGSKDKPYLIYEVEDMLKMAAQTKEVGTDKDEPTYFKLMNDIDLTGIDWQPINPDKPYAKKVDFNGNGMTIKNLVSTSAYASIFGVVFGKVYDFTVTDASISAASKAGIIGGYGGTSDTFKHSCQITNVHVVNSTVKVTGNTGAGGIVGAMCTGSIDRCSFNGTVKSNSNYCGGIVGYINKGDDCNGTKISNCIVTGSVIEDGTGHQRFGGIAGGVNGQHQIVENCIALCEVVSGTGTGGIIGMAHFDSSSASSCLGHDNTVKNCIAWNSKVYATKVKENNYSPGAIIGYASVDGNYIDCVRRADLKFEQNTEIGITDTSYPINFIVPVDQDNSDASHPLTTGIDCDHSSKHISPYHGKAAAAGETASQVAKRLG
ncbi:MAG: DUF1735 domain-containing protein, partial [Bacteroidales bacterium]|nr:DUF1735 domain-containing protein [Bacteroidales bacterium]